MSDEGRSPAVGKGELGPGTRWLLIVVALGLAILGARSATGVWVWNVLSPRYGLVRQATPVVADGLLYFATSDSGLLHGVDAKSGKLLYSLSFKEWPMFSSPAVAGRRLYIGSHAGTLIAIDLEKVVYVLVDTEGHRVGFGT